MAQEPRSREEGQRQRQGEGEEQAIFGAASRKPDNSCPVCTIDAEEEAEVELPAVLCDISCSQGLELDRPGDDALHFLSPERRIGG